MYTIYVSLVVHTSGDMLQIITLFYQNRFTCRNVPALKLWSQILGTLQINIFIHQYDLLFRLKKSLAWRIREVIDIFIDMCKVSLTDRFNIILDIKIMDMCVIPTYYCKYIKYLNKVSISNHRIVFFFFLITSTIKYWTHNYCIL